MADPRKTLNYSEIGILRATFKGDGTTITYDKTLPGGSAAAGYAVSLSANDTVQLAGDGDVVIGLLDVVEADLNCTVSVKGFLYFKAGTTPALVRGQGIVGALLGAAKGYVKGSATARGQVINDTTTAVVVLL